MKLLKTKLMLTLSLLAISLATVNAEKSIPNAEAGIVFEKGNWASILKKAKAENKIIFFDAYTTWCGPCKLLQKNVFTRDDMGTLFNKEFINVKFDMESGEGPMLAEKYPVQGYPTLFFISPDGKVIKEVIGYQKAETLIKIAKQLPKVKSNS